MDNQKKGFWQRTSEAFGFSAPESQETRDVNGPAAGVIPPAPNSISTLTPQTALSISAVYRCVSIISASISQMPLGVYRGGIEIDTPTIIKTPDFNLSQRQFIKQTVWSLAVHGNAYWRVYGKYPNIQNLEVLDPDTITVARDPQTGKVVYWQGANEIRNIKHLRLTPVPGYPKGNGPIQMGTQELLNILKVRAYAERWFVHTPKGMLTTDQPLNAADAQALLDAFVAFITKNEGTLIGHSGIRYEHFGIKPNEAQMLEIQQAQTVMVARLFGVPATLLASGNEGNSNTYTNQQELFMQFLQTTLVDYMNEIEDAFSSLLPRGQEVNFKEDALLRMNTQLETEVAVAQIGAGLITPNEWRQGKGLPALEAPAEVQSPNSNNGDEQNGDD